MSALIIYLVAAGCFSAGFAAGCVWHSLHSTHSDPDYDPQNWSDFQ